MIRNATRAFLFALLVFVPAFASASDNFTALLNIPLTVTGPDAQCKTITNVSPTGKSIYIPTSSVPEWQSFIAHPPTGVSLGSCGFYVQQVFLTSGSSWTVPADWNSANNTIEVIGGGGTGYVGLFYDPWLYQGGGGGGGGGYSSITNLSLTPGAIVSYHVGGVDEDTYFNGGSYGAASVGAKAGSDGGGDYHNPYGGAGGQASAGIGTTRYSGGTGCGGGTVNQTVVSTYGGGGGGAAGPHGNGMDCPSSSFGGSGDARIGGMSGLPGTEWGIGHGSGGGGNGGLSTGAGGATGATYGGGGAGGGSNGGPGAPGAQGIIVITYYTGGTGARTQCSDGIDNDSNGLIDMADTCACSSPADTSENLDKALCPPPPTQCSDGIDNDGNGFVDMADTCACSSPDDNDESYDFNMCPISVGSTIICTELHRQGLLPDKWMDADKQFGASMPTIVMNGYHAWARPVVSLMQRSHAFTMFVYAFAHPWAQEMAYLQGVEDHGSFLGILVMVVGVPFSALVGIFVTPWW